MNAEFLISALPADVLERIRACGRDEFGNVVAPVADESGGSPLRCCLRESSPGEQIMLIAYRPFPWVGPFAETGPVYVHAEGCKGYADPSRYPQAFAHRRQLLRAYDRKHRICEGIQAKDGRQAEKILRWLLSLDEVDFVHSRNVEWGCYMFSASRAA